MSHDPYTWEAMPWQPVFEGLRRKVIVSSGGTLVLNHLLPGAFVPVHRHSHAQVIYVLQGGGCAVYDNNERQRLDAGQLVVLAPDTAHGYQTGDTDTLMLDVFTPNRTDYEQGYRAFLQESGSD